MRVSICGALLLAAAASAAPAAVADWRDIANGTVIPDERYADQPYIVVLPDGVWLCTITTGGGREGEGGQHVVALRSTDQGKTWSRPIDIEPKSGPAASWVVPFVGAGGRVFAVYTYDTTGERSIPDAGRHATRLDTMGSFAFRYSDDGGRTWSARTLIPQRTISADLKNNFGGRHLFFWSVAKPVTDERGRLHIGYAKVTRWGEPLVLNRSRSFVLSSPNAVAERDPKRIRWEVLPEGDTGLVAPKGAIGEEFNVTPMGNGSLFGVMRTIDGYPATTYSRDYGRTWEIPEHARFAPGGRLMKQPRAFVFARRFRNGKYLMWFHNQGGEPVHAIENWDVYKGRNPGWVSAGVEKGGRIHWSEPEVLLYDKDPAKRISYPDFVEDRGGVWIAATEKETARVHPIDARFLNTIWQQFDRDVSPRDGSAVGERMPAIPSLRDGGFSLSFTLTLDDLYPGQVLLDTRDREGRGLAVTVGTRPALVATLSDGRTVSTWESDYGTHQGTLRVDRPQRVSLIVDGGPGIVRWVVDGVLNDGGATRQYGWGRYDPALGDLTSAAAVRRGPVNGGIRDLTFYPRALLTAEAVALAGASPGH